MYISLWENSRGHPDNISFIQFSTKIDGFEQKDSQGFENSYNSYEQYPLEKFFIFTIYKNYTLALKETNDRIGAFSYIIIMRTEAVSSHSLGVLVERSSCMVMVPGSRSSQGVRPGFVVIKSVEIC